MFEVQPLFKSSVLQCSNNLSAKNLYLWTELEKLDVVFPLVADPRPANSTTDTDTLPISHGQPYSSFYRQYKKQNPPIRDKPFYTIVGV